MKAIRAKLGFAFNVVPVAWCPDAVFFGWQGIGKVTTMTGATVDKDFVESFVHDCLLFIDRIIAAETNIAHAPE